MRHKVYRLGAKLSIMGLEIPDLMVLFSTWMVSLQLLGAFVHPRARFLFACLVTFIVLKVWQGVKDKVPDKFGGHIMSWITETETYSVAPDTEQHPLVVDYKVLKSTSAKPKTLEPKTLEPTPLEPQASEGAPRPV